jgi:hypothetical protein
MIYFDASRGSALSILGSKFWEASALSGAAISLFGGRNNAKRNKVVATDFAGFSASTFGGTISLQNSNVDVEMSSFINNFAVSGASSLESRSSSVSLISNNFNYTGAPQVALDLSSYSDDASLFDNGGEYCPLSYCTPQRVKNGLCDPLCNISLCQYDGGDCLCNVDTCPLHLRGNGICDLGCATSGCNYDFGDCCDVSECTFRMRNNSQCDSMCNNRACGFDGGECSVSGSSETSTRSESHADSNYKVISILKTVSDSPVLAAINKFSASVINQHNQRLSIGSSIHPDAVMQPLPSVPSAIQCTASSVSDKQSFIFARNEEVTISSESCPGLASCKSCGSCGKCTATGCDTSFFDNFCQQARPNFVCEAIVPSSSNNFSATRCVEKSSPRGPIPAAGVNLNSPASSTDQLSPGAIAGITLGVLVAIACIAAVAIRTIRRRASQNSSAVVAVHIDDSINRRDHLEASHELSAMPRNSFSEETSSIQASGNSSALVTVSVDDSMNLARDDLDESSRVLSEKPQNAILDEANDLL